MIIGSKLIYSENLTSTNTHAANLLKSNYLQEGTIIYTNFQLSGKGQAGNKWESADGKNLLFSIILYPNMINPAEQILISMAISLGICDFLMRYIPVCTIKWPNDIYVNNDKIAGILIENSILGNQIVNTVAGIGLNINQKNFLSDAPNPVSLRILTGEEFNLDLCLTELSSFLDRRYKQLVAGENNLIKEEYISKLYRFYVWSSYRDKNGIYEGRIISVTDSGKLMVEKPDGKVYEYIFKEVNFII